MEAYSQYLILQLAQAQNVVDPNEDYDTAWGMGGELLAEFEGSAFDVDTRSEYDCMWDFLITKPKFE